MGLKEFFFKSGDITLHGIENDNSSELAPLLFIPGLWGQAEQFTDILNLGVGQRKAFALSLRGRGRSDVPEQGYTLVDHVSDIEAFTKAKNIDRYFLITVSAGASYAIAYAGKNSEKLTGLIITDYPPISKSYPPQMVEGVLKEVKDIKISEKFLIGLQRESQTQDLTSELNKITCPVTIMRGGQTGSYLTEDHLNLYKKNLRKMSIKTLEDVAHDPLLAPTCFVQGLSTEI